MIRVFLNVYSFELFKVRERARERMSLESVSELNERVSELYESVS